MIDTKAIQLRWNAVGSKLDERTDETGIKAADAEMAALNITGDDCHPAWNDAIKPRSPPDS